MSRHWSFPPGARTPPTGAPGGAPGAAGAERATGFPGGRTSFLRGTGESETSGVGDSRGVVLPGRRGDALAATVGSEGEISAGVELGLLGAGRCLLLLRPGGGVGGATGFTIGRFGAEAEAGCRGVFSASFAGPRSKFTIGLKARSGLKAARPLKAEALAGGCLDGGAGPLGAKATGGASACEAC